MNRVEVQLGTHHNELDQMAAVNVAVWRISLQSQAEYFAYHIKRISCALKFLFP